MRHIPEEELHAYLDQALSRSQCIEIETHLARCLPCAELRDAIAALRDRTTALLDSTRPPRLLRPPPYEVLLGRAVIRRRRTWQRRAVWAAGMGALLVGGPILWSGLQRTVPPELVLVEAAPPPVVPPPPPEAVIVEGPESVPAEVVTMPPLAPDPSRFVETEVRLASRGPNPTMSGPMAAPAPEAARLVLESSWTPATLAEAEEATGWLVPLVPDLPVTDIRMHRSVGPERPLLIVTQRHPAAGPIHTVEGPVEDVAAIVAAQLRPGSALRSSEPSRAPPDYVETGAGVYRTQRVLAVIGRLPVDSLNALAQAVVVR